MDKFGFILEVCSRFRVNSAFSRSLSQLYIGKFGSVKKSCETKRYLNMLVTYSSALRQCMHGGV